MGWIYYAQRALTMTELREVLAVEVDQIDHLDRLNIPKPDSIIHTCGGLVHLTPHTTLVTFSHSLVREFFQNDEPKFLLSPCDIARTCLTYIGYSVFENC